LYTKMDEEQQANTVAEKELGVGKVLYGCGQLHNIPALPQLSMDPNNLMPFDPEIFRVDGTQQKQKKRKPIKRATKRDKNGKRLRMKPLPVKGSKKGSKVPQSCEILADAPSPDSPPPLQRSPSPVTFDFDLELAADMFLS